MECPNCGDLLHEGARYCSRCGTRIRERPTPPPDETQAQAPIPPVARPGNAIVGYQAAVNIWVAQTQLIWSRFNVMIIANSIILAAIGLAMWGNHPLSVPFTRALCLAGLVVSLAWLVAYRRASQLSSYFLSSARELEGQLTEPVVTISRGIMFSEGKEVTLTIDGEKKKLRLSWLARTGLAENESFYHVLVAIFMVLYVGLLLPF